MELLHASFHSGNAQNQVDPTHTLLWVSSTPPSHILEMADIRRKAIKAQEYFHLSRSPIPRQIIRGGAAPLSDDTAPESVVVDPPVGFVEASDPNVANSQPELIQCAAIKPNEMVNQWTQIAGPPHSSTRSASTASTASTTTNPSITASPSCAADNSVPTGVPQDLVKFNITEWCGLLGVEGERVGCDNKHHDGFYLSTSCDIPNLALDYYYPGVIMTLEVAITKGSIFTVNETTCDQALHAVLNYCPPPSAVPGETFMKYGGNKTVDDGAGHTALFSMKLTSNPGSPGIQPRDSGNTG